MSTPPRLLVIAQDRLDGQVAGTSIRALEQAAALSGSAEVTLAAVGTPPAEIRGLPCVGYDPQHPKALAPVLDGSDVVISLPQWPQLMRLLKRSGLPVAFDLYVPQPIEILTGFDDPRMVVRETMVDFAIDRTLDACAQGAFLTCASEQQRDLYLGMLLAERMLGQGRLVTDPSLRSLIDVVPFGVSDEPCIRTGPGLRERFPQVEADDPVIIWNGGIWPWLDPLTIVRAVAILRHTRPNIRFVFMGMASQDAAAQVARTAQEEAQRLGLAESNVLFNDRWVPYEERAAWLLDADVAVYAHHDHLETRFAFRTRVLDCIWAGLPVACTSGDQLGEQLAASGAGATFAPGDADGAAVALAQLLDGGRDAFAAPLAQLADRYRWSQAIAPLREFVSNRERWQLRGAGSPHRRRAAHSARHHGFRALRKAADTVGRPDWPRL